MPTVANIKLGANQRVMIHNETASSEGAMNKRIYTENYESGVKRVVNPDKP